MDKEKLVEEDEKKGEDRSSKARDSSTNKDKKLPEVGGVVMSRYWLSSRRLTTTVTVSPSGLVIESAPITHRFVGQPFNNLVRWMSRQGGLLKHQYKE